MYKTIKTDTHLLLVDEMVGIIKDGDKILCDERFHKDENPQYVIRTCKNIENGWINTIELEGQGENPEWTSKIIASYPKVEGVLEFETLPPTKANIEQRAVIIFKEQFGINPISIQTHADILKGIRVTLKSIGQFIGNEIKEITREEANIIPHYQSKDGKFFTIDFSLSKSKEYEFIVQNKEATGSAILGGFNEPLVINNKIQGTWQEIK